MSEQQIEMEAAKLFRGPCEFVKGVVSMDGLPDGGRPEIAFAGRSNVGKSSLLNALVGRKSLARSSNSPGRTREINYFDLGSRLYLVDMPGYGYARASRKQVEGWNRLIRDYLRGRASLLRVFLLIDARHGLKPNDLEIMAMLDESAVSYQIVLTKLDKLKQAAQPLIIEKTSRQIASHPAAFPQILATSAHKKSGLEQLRESIFALLESASAE